MRAFAITAPALAAAFLAAALAQGLFQPAALHAHAVYLFAYANGDEVCTESYFSKNSRVMGGTVTMSDANGTLLESAGTGDDGNHCFPMPKTQGDLLFAVDAGQGHRAEFRLRAEDRPDPGEADAAPPAPGAGGGPGAAPEQAPPATNPGAGAGGALSQGDVRAIVREELKSQLGPIARTLAEAKDDKTPGLREIVGGLGWIVGLLGVIILARGRKPPTPERKD
ncbi:MAG: hypothetical protein LBF40_07190 [Deltaproteobacteria bacterium]|jgi:nickel transport protein|nr:hypothetical protein [Deltaproteobacteria bacterium]